MWSITIAGATFDADVDFDGKSVTITYEGMPSFNSWPDGVGTMTKGVVTRSFEVMSADSQPHGGVILGVLLS